MKALIHYYTIQTSAGRLFSGAHLAKFGAAITQVVAMN
jgi:hypothetical protein